MDLTNSDRVADSDVNSRGLDKRFKWGFKSYFKSYNFLLQLFFTVSFSFYFSGSSPECGVPDMTVISNIDEIGINRNLQVRYSRDQIYVSFLTIYCSISCIAMLYTAYIHIRTMSFGAKLLLCLFDAWNIILKLRQLKVQYKLISEIDFFLNDYLEFNIKWLFLNDYIRQVKLVL